MKKTLLGISLALFFSLSVFAGDQPGGNKTCPTSAPCLTGDQPGGDKTASITGDQPWGNKTAPASVAGDQPAGDKTAASGILDAIREYLVSVFG